MRSSNAARSPRCRYSCTAAAIAAPRSGDEEIMTQNYSDRSGVDASRATSAAMVAEPGADTALARELLAILLPTFDTDRLLRALLAERAAQAAVVDADDADVEPY